LDKAEERKVLKSTKEIREDNKNRLFPEQFFSFLTFLVLFVLRQKVHRKIFDY